MKYSLPQLPAIREDKNGLFADILSVRSKTDLSRIAMVIALFAAPIAADIRFFL